MDNPIEEEKFKPPRQVPVFGTLDTFEPLQNTYKGYGGISSKPGLRIVLKDQKLPGGTGLSTLNAFYKGLHDKWANKEIKDPWTRVENKWKWGSQNAIQANINSDIAHHQKIMNAFYNFNPDAKDFLRRTISIAPNGRFGTTGYYGEGRNQRFLTIKQFMKANRIPTNTRIWFSRTKKEIIKAFKFMKAYNTFLSAAKSAIQPIRETAISKDHDIIKSLSTFLKTYAQKPRPDSNKSLKLLKQYFKRGIKVCGSSKTMGQVIKNWQNPDTWLFWRMIYGFFVTTGRQAMTYGDDQASQNQQNAWGFFQDYANKMAGITFESTSTEQKLRDMYKLKRDYQIAKGERKANGDWNKMSIKMIGEADNNSQRIQLSKQFGYRGGFESINYVVPGDPRLEDSRLITFGNQGYSQGKVKYRTHDEWDKFTQNVQGPQRRRRVNVRRSQQIGSQQIEIQKRPDTPIRQKQITRDKLNIWENYVEGYKTSVDYGHEIIPLNIQASTYALGLSKTDATSVGVPPIKLQEFADQVDDAGKSMLNLNFSLGNQSNKNAKSTLRNLMSKFSPTLQYRDGTKEQYFENE